MAFCCIIKVIGFANLQNLLDMKIIEIVKINRELLRNLHIAGVRLDDTNYIDLYTELLLSGNPFPHIKVKG